MCRLLCRITPSEAECITIRCYSFHIQRHCGERVIDLYSVSRAVCSRIVVLETTALFCKMFCYTLFFVSSLANLAGFLQRINNGKPVI